MNLGRVKSAALLLLAGVLHAPAEGFRLESVGTRAGTSKIGSSSQFYQVDAFANWNLPWHWEYESGWRIATRLDLTTGWLHGREDDGFIGSIGPTVEMGWKRFPLVLEGGWSPTILSRDEFGPSDFGMPFQFTTHGSLLWRTGSRLTLEARFQHMSNADMSSSNPGLNMYMLGAGWRF